MISISVVDKKAYQHQLRDGTWKLNKGSLLVALGFVVPSMRHT